MSNGTTTAICSGLTRTEVVVVVVLLLLAAMIGAPLLYQQLVQSRRMLCENRQREIGQALLRFESRQGEFPGYRNLQAIDRDGKRRDTSWVMPILPYLLADDKTNQPGPYAHVAFQYGPEGPDATRGQTPQTYLAEFVCPDDPPTDDRRRPTWLSFVVNTGMPDAPPSESFPCDWAANGVFFDRFATVPAEFDPQRQMTLDYINQHDGNLFTMLLSENVDSGNWSETGEAQVGFVWLPRPSGDAPVSLPRPLPINHRRGEGDGSVVFARPSSRHAGGVNVTYASGATAFLSDKVDELVLARRMASNGAELRWPGSDQFVDAPYRRSGESN